MKLYKEGMPELVDFKVMSRYKYKQIGDPVVYQDHIQLLNSDTGMFINMSTTRDMKPLNLPGDSSAFSKHVPFRRPIPENLFHRYEINANFSITKSKF